MIYRDECRGEHMLGRCLAAQRFPNNVKCCHVPFPQTATTLLTLPKQTKMTNFLEECAVLSCPTLGNSQEMLKQTLVAVIE
jgi:hypothetical protein